MPQCQAFIYTDQYRTETRQCKRAASESHRLCKTHLRQRHELDNPQRYVITFNRKGRDYVGKDRFGHSTYRINLIGKTFLSREDAELWCNLNATQIWAIPGISSYCIEPLQRVQRSLAYRRKACQS